MIRPLRRVHRVVTLVLLILLPVFLGLALGSRRHGLLP
jgi:hypothetical protein